MHIHRLQASKDIIVIYSSSIYFFILIITYTRWRHAKCSSFLFWGKIKVIYKLFIKALRYILKEKWYVHNIFTIFLQQILSDRLLLVVIVRAKSNLSVRFKFEPITTNHLWFVVKILSKCCGRNTSQKKFSLFFVFWPICKCIVLWYTSQFTNL